MTDPRQPDVVTVAVTRVDGGLTVVRLVVADYAPDGRGGRAVVRQVVPTPAYIDANLAKYGWTGGEAVVSWRIVPNDFVDDSTDRTYRNAWKDAGHGKPDHDMTKAREVHRDILRRVRTRLLDDLDVQYQMADEQGDQQRKRAVAVEKQRLRDITNDPRIDAAQTVDDLKAITVGV